MHLFIEKGTQGGFQYIIEKSWLKDKTRFQDKTSEKVIWLKVSKGAVNSTKGAYIEAVNSTKVAYIEAVNSTKGAYIEGVWNNPTVNSTKRAEQKVYATVPL